MRAVPVRLVDGECECRHAVAVPVVAVVLSVDLRVHTAQIHPSRKDMLYHHLYSYSSVKAVVHWFQILRTGGHLKMYEDAPPSRYRVPPLYDITTIRVPIAAFVGGKDTVIDAKRFVCGCQFCRVSVPVSSPSLALPLSPSRRVSVVSVCGVCTRL
jgi:hypothetical protein